MAADPQCARCKQPIGPGWLYLVRIAAARPRQPTTARYLFMCPMNAHGPGTTLPGARRVQRPDIAHAPTAFRGLC
jgi:hypothetical protein